MSIKPPNILSHFNNPKIRTAMTMSIQKLLQLALIELLLSAAATSAHTFISPPPPPPSDPDEEVTMAKPNCQEKCGDVVIPYPFGTTEDCYLNKDFLITCNHTFHPPKPFLSNVSEVTSISVDGKLHIENYMAMDCFDKSGAPRVGHSNSLNLSKFLISDTDNKFVATGCDTQAVIEGFKGGKYGYTGGCITRCGSKDYVANYSCDGIGCCETPISKGMTSFRITVSSYRNHKDVWEFNPCSAAFVVEEGMFNFTYDMLSDENHEGHRVPVVLDWSVDGKDTDIKTCRDVKRKIESHEIQDACGGRNSTCSDVENGFGYRCKCVEGYKGNPYLPDGCQDINECRHEKLNNCTERCENAEGSYTCSCPEGYHGDGRKDGSGCTADSAFIIQITVGVGVGLLFFLVCSTWLYLGYNRWKLIKLKEKFFQQNGGLMLQQQLSERQGMTHETAKIFTAEELKKATSNYDEKRVIGRGGFGTVYKGVLTDGRVVAIKKSKIMDQNQIEQFINEVLVLSQINHRNVVKLLGCCFETEVPLLVYEFITKGTLFDYLHNGNPIWEIRLRIATETAGALSYLHSAASVPIIHRDVKSTNILLDESLTAKVSDFGASRLLPLDQAQLNTMVQGTLGYLDPEYFLTSQLTEKSDVYSFGVVLVELMTRKKALSFDRPEEERNLAAYFLSALKGDRLVDVLDECIAANTANIEQLKEVSNLARRCLRVKGEERPSMKEVAMELEGLRRMVMHPWVKDDSKLVESEYLLGVGGMSFETMSYEGGAETSAGYDTMKEHIVLPVNDGR